MAAVLLCAAAVAGLLPTEKMTGVSDLTVETHDRAVTRTHHWLTMFYSKDCGWCQELSEEWVKIGEAAKGNSQLRIGKFNALAPGADAITSKYGVRGFPTVVLQMKDGTRRRYSGSRTAESILEFVGKHTGVVVEVPGVKKIEGGSGEVIEVTPYNWNEVVDSTERDVFVKFYAPWCGHCKSMAPEWVSLAESNKGVTDLLIAEVNADEHKHLARHHDIQGFPTLKWYSKSNKKGETYQGARAAAAMQDFIDTSRK
eukprot:TRINITY_DN2760_c0_g2_i1.p1 TRINITY_DN2760_c0_g2~~TRINITY_DN2760_c0_g2_i1.p1  ORF type:complete len:277 (+),score=107.17 TRINITY_DN2760_c0_g2_i1:64-831(+)